MQDMPPDRQWNWVQKPQEITIWLHLQSCCVLRTTGRQQMPIQLNIWHDDTPQIHCGTEQVAELSLTKPRDALHQDKRQKFKTVT